MAQLNVFWLKGRKNSQNMLSEVSQMLRYINWMVLAASYTSVAQCLLPRHCKAMGGPASL